MIILISLLLAQSAPLQIPFSWDETPTFNRHARHPSASSTPSPTPEVRITVVNATSVPVIALNTRGTNRPFAYPYFPQGTWTGNDPIMTNAVDYLALTTNGRLIARHTQKFPPVSSQILLLTGDLSTSGPADSLPQIGLPTTVALTPWPPNLQFHTYPCTKSTNAPSEGKDICRYRIVNGMPSKLLILRASAEGGKPGRQLALLAPGNSALFIKQPANLRWEAEIEGQIYPVVMEQENDQRNCLIPFFLRNGVPSFIRVFENP